MKAFGKHTDTYVTFIAWSLFVKLQSKPQNRFGLHFLCLEYQSISVTIKTISKVSYLY